MDRGFRSGDRYVDAEALAFLLGRPFTFENEDGSETTFRPEDFWLHDYDGPNPELQAIRDTFKAAPVR